MYSIEISNLTKKFKEKIAVNNISLKIKEGELFALLGTNGAGKTTTIKMLSTLGADAVGMSTVVETIAAVHCGLKVGAISMISNMACGIYDKPLSGEDVTIAAKKAGPQFRKLIKEIIKAL